jgi:hypothetical protein
LGLSQPILPSKVLDVGEFLFIIGDDGATKSKRLSRNEQVVGADWSASLLKSRTQQSVGSIGRHLEGQDVKRPKHRFQLGREPWRASFGRPITQCRDDDNAGANMGGKFSSAGTSFANTARRDLGGAAQ